MFEQVIKDKEEQKTWGQSDESIVSKKQGNACGEKGFRKERVTIRET